MKKKIPSNSYFEKYKEIKNAIFSHLDRTGVLRLLLHLYLYMLVVFVFEFVSVYVRLLLI